MIKRLYYAWFEPKENVFRLSLYPADAPVRPSIALQSKAEVDDVIKRKKAQIMWWPPLPAHLADAHPSQ